jgi:hypothetical protein
MIGSSEKMGMAIPELPSVEFPDNGDNNNDGLVSPPDQHPSPSTGLTVLPLLLRLVLLLLYLHNCVFCIIYLIQYFTYICIHTWIIVIILFYSYLL